MNIKYTEFLTKISVITLIISSLLLPSGNLAGIPVKHAAYIFCVTALLAHWLKGAKISGRILLLFMATLLFCFFYLLVATLRSAVHFYYAFTEGMTFLVTLTISLLILMANSCKAIKNEEVILAAFYGIFAFSIMKTTIVVLAALNIVPLENLLAFIEKYMRFQPIADEIPGGLHRITLGLGDFVAVLFLFLVPTYPQLFLRVPIPFRAIFMIMGIFVLISSFSRYKFGFIAMLWAYSFLFKFSFKQRLITCFIIAVVLLSSLPWLIEVYEYRFSSVRAEYSDSLRFEQIPPLIAAWENLPLIGGGLGYYAKDYTRSNVLLYAYEVQWVSFLAKFGILGISFLGFLVFLLFYKILSGRRSLDHYALAFALLCFILSGFTNPILLNSTAAVFYILPLIIASALRETSSSPFPTSKLSLGDSRINQ
ncbi:MAG: hypothetical protein FWG26_06445 [Betaproteobacteria bacterium]|nr:hypothetical protein [Betaproteobacteria bacterium]